MLVEPPTPLLPGQFGSWTQMGVAPGIIESRPNPALSPTPLSEDGLNRTSALAYHNLPAGKDTIAVHAFQFDDATGAYSAYTFLRKPEMRDLPESRRVGTDSASAGGDFLFRSGTTVVQAQVSAVGASTIPALRLLASTLPKVGGTKGLSPLLPTYLPAKGLQRDSVKYSLGPVGYQAQGGVLPPGVVGFDKAAEAVTAKYESKGTLTLLLYPTPQIAGDRGRQIEAEMNKEGLAAGTVKLRREGPLVLLTTGPWRPAEAQEMVESIHLRDELTWNKPIPPEFHSEVRKTVSLLTSVLIFCGLGALAAVVIALFLGGARAAIRVMQGKPAATEPEFLRIDLSGRPARIQPEGPEASPRG